MKVIIAGSRGIVDQSQVDKAMQGLPWESNNRVTEVVSGGARGVDLMGETWAARRNIRIRQFIPDWDGIGKGAGFIRNRQMAEYADALVAIWDGVSRGTANMISEMNKLHKPVNITFVGYGDEDDPSDEDFRDECPNT